MSTSGYEAYDDALYQTKPLRHLQSDDSDCPENLKSDIKEYMSGVLSNSQYSDSYLNDPEVTCTALNGGINGYNVTGKLNFAEEGAPVDSDAVEVVFQISNVTLDTSDTGDTYSAVNESFSGAAVIPVCGVDFVCQAPLYVCSASSTNGSYCKCANGFLDAATTCTGQNLMIGSVCIANCTTCNTNYGKCAIDCSNFDAACSCNAYRFGPDCSQDSKVPIIVGIVVAVIVIVAIALSMYGYHRHRKSKKLRAELEARQRELADDNGRMQFYLGD